MTELERLSQFSNAVLSPELNCDLSKTLRLKTSGKSFFDKNYALPMKKDEIEFRKAWCKEQSYLLGEFGAVFGVGK